MTQCSPENSLETLNYLKSLNNVIDPICLPLNNHNIKFFTYSRVYEDGSVIFLCNKAEWYNTKFENNLFEENGFITLPYLYANKYTKTIFTGVPNSNIKVLSHLFQMDFWNSVDLYKCRDDYKEVFHFASARDNTEIINFYVNNFEILECFADQFHNKIFDMVERNLNRLNLKITSSNRSITLINNEQEEKSIKKKTNIISFNGKHVSLSHRQIQCLLLNAKGKTAKEIGRELAVSNRTIEDHFEILRDKFNCSSRRDLIALVMDNIEIKNLLYQNYIFWLLIVAKKQLHFSNVHICAKSYKFYIIILDNLGK